MMKKNNAWNIRCLVDEYFVPASQQTSISYWEMTDFRSLLFVCIPLQQNLSPKENLISHSNQNENNIPLCYAQFGRGKISQTRLDDWLPNKQVITIRMHLNTDAVSKKRTSTLFFTCPTRPPPSFRANGASARNIVQLVLAAVTSLTPPHTGAGEFVNIWGGGQLRKKVLLPSCWVNGLKTHGDRMCA